MCQSWSAVKPHRSMFLTDEGHNYCRNPNNDPRGPWCYTIDDYTEKAYCDICDMRTGEEPTASTGTCGNPKVIPEFHIAKFPTNMRSKRSAQSEDYYDYASYDQQEAQGRNKVFPMNRTQNSLAGDKNQSNLLLT